MMRAEQRSRRLYQFARWLFVIAAVVLWVPSSWRANPNNPGTHVDVEFGVLKPLQATWESSPNGFWFGFSDVRVGALALSAVLTAAAVLAAREMDRSSRTAPPTAVLPSR